MSSSSVPRGVYWRYILCRYCFLPALLLIVILVMSPMYFLSPSLKKLPRDVGAAIVTAYFEATYLPMPAMIYFAGKWWIKKLREFYEKYGLGSERDFKGVEYLKPFFTVLAVLYAIFGILWGWYFYTHWPNIAV